MNLRLVPALCAAIFFVLTSQSPAWAAASNSFPTLDAAIAAGHDLWGEAAMREPNGASYEFFEKLLPPPRYVNADFHYYPLVLSAPNARVKARLISNGSGLNLPGGARGWDYVGTPVTFRVGPDELRFGEIADRVEHPTLAEGYLPIPQILYTHGGNVFAEEAFAATDTALASNGIVLVKFSLASGTNDFITAEFEAKSSVTFSHGILRDAEGKIVAWFDANWEWERKRAHAKISTNTSATFALFTKPAVTSTTSNAPAFNYAGERQKCVTAWDGVLARAMNVETPEPLVNRAWKNLIIQDFMVCKGDNLFYSTGNAYEKMYAAETSDAAIPLMNWGYESDMRGFLPVILDLTDRRLTNHFAAHKLDALCRFYWQTHDVSFVQSLRPRWQKELDWILDQRGGPYGLLPKDNYCTDIERPVYSLSANASCWAALRDLAPVLREIGDAEMSRRVAAIAPKYKKDILEVVQKNLRYETDPPFIPMALFNEDVHDPITATRIGSYWDLVANYVIGSRIFAGSERENWLPKYLETHGGLFMGLTRSAATNHTFWTGMHRTNPLYGMRYIIEVLRRGDPERALVSFYGMLAHGMTRNTFIGAEGTSIQPLDSGGRYFYFPPNTASNGQWLWTLRHLLVQDFDLDENGEPETLRLLFATPKRWLEDGKRIKIERAPTAFGPVSLDVESRLVRGEVIVHAELPERNPPAKTFLRIRLPDGWKVVSSQNANRSFHADKSGAIDISALRGSQTLTFRVAKK